MLGMGHLAHVVLTNDDKRRIEKGRIILSGISSILLDLIYLPPLQRTA